MSQPQTQTPIEGERQALTRILEITRGLTAICHDDYERAALAKTCGEFRTRLDRLESGETEAIPVRPAFPAKPKGFPAASRKSSDRKEAV